MATPLDKFVRVSPPIDAVREEAACCADETAKMERGERGPVRICDNRLVSEFSGEAAGVAAEVALIVKDALKAQRVRFDAAFCWSTAATLLRSGWQRGHSLIGHVAGAKEPS